MPRDDYQSLGDENTFDGGEPDSNREPQSLGDEATFGGDAGYVDDAFDDDMEIVDLAARYTTEGTLGKGGMGEVLLATDTRLERKVAIKRILGSAARSKTAVNRFLTEAKSIAALNHPNIVQIYDYGRAKDGPFLIMEYVEGSSLLNKCREGAIPLEEAIDVACQLCDGLSKAHAANIVHRDIKPANVLLTQDGVPKLTDFGLAKDEAADTGMTMAGAVLGTLDFMPPEQRKDAALADNRSDLWSLAATLYQMTTGESPRVIDLDEVPAELRKCIAKALKSKKEDRYQTAVELRDALRLSLQEAVPTVVQQASLGDGECPECHTQNEANRKFCRECAGPLRIKCLKCESEMAVWDNVCGECGGKQQELIDARLSDLQRQRERAEELRSQFEYRTCLEIAKEIFSIQDDRLSQHKVWAEEFAKSVDTEWKQQQDSARQHFDEARKHREVFDYDSAIHAIESIPDAILTSEMRSYLQALESDRTELVSLVSEIRASIQKRDLDQLLPKVDRALKLKADHVDLNTLQQQLMTRKKKLEKKRDDACFEAAVLLADGNARAALELVKKVQTELTSSQQELHDNLKEIVSAEARLSSLLKEAKSSGAMKQKSVVELLSRSVDYLKLNPKHESIGKLKQDLQQKLTNCSEDALADLPDQVLAGLPVTILAELPVQTLGRLPVQVLAKLPPQVLSRLPPQSLSRLPVQILSKLSMQTLARLPVPVRAQLPAPTLVKLPAIVNSIGMKLKLLPPGVFRIGRIDPHGGEELQREHGVGSLLPHKVTLTKAFAIGVYQVTQSEFQHVMGMNPSLFIGTQNPVERISWNDAVRFCRKLSAKQDERRAKRIYRLPTEAEWEYACRAGTTTTFGFGKAGDAIDVDDYLWHGNNSNGTTHPVGLKKANAWGLYDMHGNVSEWCADRCSKSLVEDSEIDPQGPKKGDWRVMRGGAFLYHVTECHSFARNGGNPTEVDANVGFRVACDVQR